MQNIRTIRTPGLGDATYMLSHRGLAIVVDPQRDIDRFLEAAGARDAEIRFVLETHVHNDYISGGRALAGELAQLLLPAGAGVAFEHVPAFHKEDIAADAGLVIRPDSYTGPYSEHVSYLGAGRWPAGRALLGRQPAGRTRAGAIARAVARSPLARLQYASAHLGWLDCR